MIDSRANQISRRHFVRAGAVAAAAISFPFVGNVLGANDRINVAGIGVGGKGDVDTDETAKCGVNFVAICDVDQVRLQRKAQKFPQAALFGDFRKMLEKMGKSIDAVTISTPDHCHAAATMMAMSMGKHVFCQKPLTQTILEARRVFDLAAKKNLATQMGTQGSATDGLRHAIEVVQAGVIGSVRELHIWTNRPIWPQGLDRPPGADPVPPGLDWDTWLGPAARRPFKKGVYHPFNWRGWKDFGTGALGDMGCHVVNMPFRALKLGYPNVVECEETSALFAETYPKSSRIRFEFPERQGLPPLKFWWYDGNINDTSTPVLRPPSELTREIADISERVNLSGCLLVGDKGKVFSPSDIGDRNFLMLSDEKSYSPLSQHEAARAVPQSIPRSPGHYMEWVRAIQGGPPAFSNFSIAARLTEIILLGCIALRVGPGKGMHWDGPRMKSSNCPEAAHFVHRQYRKGWSI